MIGPAPMRIAVLLLAILAITFAVISAELGFWVEQMPGPGLLCFAAALLLLPVLAAVYWAQPLADDEKGFDATTLLTLPLICIYAFVVPYTALVPGTILLVLLWVRFFHRQSWARAAVLSVCLVAGFAILFKGFLGAPIPLFPDWS